MTLNEEEIAHLFDALDDACWSCQGGESKTPVLKLADGACEVCHGKQFHLTAAGKRLLEFLKRHGIESKGGQS